jgi:hypothetical protein
MNTTMTSENRAAQDRAVQDHDLDDLKSTWKALGEQLQRQNPLQLAELRERSAGSIRSSLRPLFWGQIVQMLFGVGFLLLGVAMWKIGFGVALPLFIAGIIAHVYGVATAIASGVVLGQIAKIDASLPVVEMQHRLLRLRKTYLIGGMVVGLPWWVLWVVPLFVIASLHAMKTGVVDSGVPLWLWLCLAGGIAGLIGTGIFHRWLHRPGREALAKRMDDAAAGGSLRRAQAELDALKRYQRDDD